MQIRVLVSSYLFLSGFGHFYYFFKTGDFSLNRFCTVSIKHHMCLNLALTIRRRTWGQTPSQFQGQKVLYQMVGYINISGKPNMECEFILKSKVP